MTELYLRIATGAAILVALFGLYASTFGAGSMRSWRIAAAVTFIAVFIGLYVWSKNKWQDEPENNQNSPRSKAGKVATTDRPRQRKHVR